MTEQNSRQEADLPFWMGFVFFLVVVFCCVYLSMAAQRWLQDSQQLPISQIKIDGEPQYVTNLELYQALQSQLSKSFFSLDVNQAQAALQQINWVEFVAVRKEWPETLKVYVVEQEPVAIWNQDYLLNQKGEVFQADKSRLKTNLPLLSGPEGSAPRVWQIYQQFAGLLNLHGLTAQALTVSERFSIQLNLTTGVALKLGRENGEHRVRRFLKYYPQLQQRHDLKYVDLRYDTGFAVGENETQS